MALGESFQFEIGADIRDAQESLGALKRRLQDLKGDVAAVDNNEIDVEVDQRDLDDATEAVDELKRTAARGIDIDVDVDPARNAGRAADDIRRMNVNADGLQSGIGPLRGFTDELGGTAAAGGTAANALIDAGLTVAPTLYQSVAAGSADDGRVIGQTPQPGESVEPGTTVTITVGRSDTPITTLPPITAPPQTTPPATDPPATDPPATEAPTTNG